MGLGSHRYRVTFKGPGGHSWGAFGLANPAHALGRGIHYFENAADTLTRTGPRTSYNVGVIGGGTSVNSIPFEAWADVDMRSESPASLDAHRRALHAAVERALGGREPASPPRRRPHAGHGARSATAPRARWSDDNPWCSAPCRTRYSGPTRTSAARRPTPTSPSRWACRPSRSGGAAWAARTTPRASGGSTGTVPRRSSAPCCSWWRSGAGAHHAVAAADGGGPPDGVPLPQSPRMYPNISGATMVASELMLKRGVSSPSSLPQVIFSLAGAPEYPP